LNDIRCDSEAEGTEGESEFCHKQGTGAALLICEGGGIGFEHTTEKRDGKRKDGEEEGEREEDANWDGYEQAIESSEWAMFA